MKTLIFSFKLFFVLGCQKRPERKINVLDSLNSKTTINKTIRKSHSLEIQDLIKRTKPINLPFVYNIWEDELNNIKSEPNDSIFIHPYNSIVGYLPDTSNYYGIIVMAPADALLPILYTFDKAGNNINKDGLYLYKCGPDCGLDCEEYSVINDSLEISLISKSIIYQCEDNPDDNDIIKISKTTQKGLISSSGKIIFQDVINENYTPDSIEVDVSGWNSNYYEGGNNNFKENVKIKWINDTTINYLINFEELEMGCETKFWGTAINKCINCEPEIVEYKKEHFQVYEYVTHSDIVFISSIRISINKNYASIRLNESVTPKDECMPYETIIMKKYAR